MYPTVPIFNDRILVYKKNWKNNIKRYLRENKNTKYISTKKLIDLIIDTDYSFTISNLQQCINVM